MEVKDLNEIISEYCSGRKSLQQLPELFNPLENIDINLTFGFYPLERKLVN